MQPEVEGGRSKGGRDRGITTFLLQGDRRQHSVGEEERVESNWVTFKNKRKKNKHMTNVNTVTQQYVHNKRNQG